MKKRLLVCLLLCALLCSCRGGGESPDAVKPPTDQTSDQNASTDASRIEYYEQLVNDLQKEILALRTEIYVNRVEYEALMEDLLAEKPPVDGEAPTETPDFFYTVKDGKATVTAYVGKATEVTVPATVDGCPVVAIGDRAFMGRTDVTSVTLPDGVEQLGWFSFSGCVALRHVSLPDSVASIGYGSFDNCPRDLTLVCTPDSYAAQYAKSYGIAAGSACTH